jgi:hypothetical protein
MYLAALMREHGARAEPDLSRPACPLRLHERSAAAWSRVHDGCTSARFHPVGWTSAKPQHRARKRCNLGARLASLSARNERMTEGHGHHRPKGERKESENDCEALSRTWIKP